MLGHDGSAVDPQMYRYVLGPQASSSANVRLDHAVFIWNMFSRCWKSGTGWNSGTVSMSLASSFGSSALMMPRSQRLKWTPAAAPVSFQPIVPMPLAVMGVFTASSHFSSAS